MLWVLSYHVDQRNQTTARPQGQGRKTTRILPNKPRGQRGMSISSCYATKLTQVQFPQNLSTPLQAKDRKRKRPQEAEDPPFRIPAKPLQKRLRTSLTSSAVKDTIGQEVTSGVSENKVNPIDYWTRRGSWPKKYFEQDDQTRKDFKREFEKDSWFEKYWEPESNTNHLLARKKSSSSLRCKISEASSVAPSSNTPRDQMVGEENSASYSTRLAKRLWIEMRLRLIHFTDRSSCGRP